MRSPLITLDLRVRHFTLRWACPAWAIDESLRAVALLLPWLLWFARQPGIGRRMRTPTGDGWARVLLAGPPGPAPWSALRDALRGETPAWRPPAGEPLLSLEVGRDVRIHLT